jgi:hypothetical protein
VGHHAESRAREHAMWDTCGLSGGHKLKCSTAEIEAKRTPTRKPSRLTSTLYLAFLCLVNTSSTTLNVLRHFGCYVASWVGCVCLCLCLWSPRLSMFARVCRDSVFGRARHSPWLHPLAGTPCPNWVPSLCTKPPLPSAKPGPTAPSGSAQRVPRVSTAQCQACIPQAARAFVRLGA